MRLSNHKEESFDGKMQQKFKARPASESGQDQVSDRCDVVYAGFRLFRPPNPFLSQVWCAQMPGFKFLAAFCTTETLLLVSRNVAQGILKAKLLDLTLKLKLSRCL